MKHIALPLLYLLSSIPCSGQMIPTYGTCASTGGTTFIDARGEPAQPQPFEYDGRYRETRLVTRSLEVITGLKKLATPAKNTDDPSTPDETKVLAELKESPHRTNLFFYFGRNAMLTKQTRHFSSKGTWPIETLNYFDKDKCGTVARRLSTDPLQKKFLWKMVWISMEDQTHYEFWAEDFIARDGTSGLNGFDIVKLASIAANAAATY